MKTKRTSHPLQHSGCVLPLRIYSKTGHETCVVPCVDFFACVSAVYSHFLLFNGKIYFFGFASLPATWIHISFFARKRRRRRRGKSGAFREMRRNNTKEGSGAEGNVNEAKEEGLEHIHKILELNITLHYRPYKIFKCISTFFTHTRFIVPSKTTGVVTWAWRGSFRKMFEWMCT